MRTLGLRVGGLLALLGLAGNVIAEPVSGNPWMQHPPASMRMPPVWVPPPYPAGGFPFLWVPFLPPSPPPAWAPPSRPAEPQAPGMPAQTPEPPLPPPPAPLPDASAPAGRLLALAQADAARYGQAGQKGGRPLPDAARKSLEEARAAMEARDFMLAIEHSLSALETMRAQAPQAPAPVRATPRRPAASKPQDGTKPAASPATGKRKLCWKGDRLDVCP